MKRSLYRLLMLFIFSLLIISILQHVSWIALVPLIWTVGIITTLVGIFLYRAELLNLYVSIQELKNKHVKETMVKKMLVNARKQVKSIEAKRKELPLWNPVRYRLRNTVKLLNKIIDYGNKNKLSVPRIRRCFTYYLPSLETSVEKYVELSKNNANTYEIQSIRKKAEDSFMLFHYNFQKELEMLLSPTMLDLDAEITVFEQETK